jgi:hypothetical protein
MDQASYPWKTKGKMTASYILIFNFLERRQEGRFPSARWTAFLNSIFTKSSFCCECNFDLILSLSDI